MTIPNGFLPGDEHVEELDLMLKPDDGVPPYEEMKKHIARASAGKETSIPLIVLWEGLEIKLWLKTSQYEQGHAESFLIGRYDPAHDVLAPSRQHPAATDLDLPLMHGLLVLVERYGNWRLIARYAEHLPA